MKVHGVALSPFVRKVHVALEEKGLEFESVPVMPMTPQAGSPEFRRISPLGKVPALEDGDFAISDSSIILDYVDRTQSGPSLYPSEPQQRARAVWLEEFADSKLAEGVGPVFFQRRVAPVMGGETDQAAIDEALNERLPPLFEYLEGQIDGDHLVGGEFSVADVAVGAMLRTFEVGGERPDAERWPKLAAYAETVLARASFQKCREREEALMASMTGS